MEIYAAAFVVHALTAQSFGSGLGPIPGEERFQNLGESGELTGGGNAGIGYTELGGERFLQLQINTDFSIGDVGVGVSIPLNLRLSTDSDEIGRIRPEDWDEPYDFFRVLRYVRYGQKRDPFYARVGDLASQIGHGTIISRYLNNLDINTRRLGIELDVNTNYGGVETMVGDVGSVFSDKNGSRMVGARVYVKPVAFADPESLWNIFAIGASYVADLNAPLTLAAEQDVEANGALIAETTTNLGIFGIDAEAELLNTDLLSIIPYMDMNFIDQAGSGFHLGTLFTFKFPLLINLQLPVRLEYRRFSNDYRPIYFSSFYEVERFNYTAETEAGGAPKAQFIQNLGDGDGGINGYFADAALDLVGILQLGAVYEDYQGGDPNVAIFLNVPALQIIQLKAFYTKTGIADLDDLFTLDDRSYAVAEANYAIFYPLYFVARASRRWELSRSTDRYESIDTWDVGVQIQFEY